MRLFRDDDLFGRFLLHEDIALMDRLRTSGDNEDGLTLVADRGVAIADDADLTVADARAGLQADP